MAIKKPVVKPASASPKGPAAKATFTMRQLWRMTVWGGAAACALFIAVLASRSNVGSERIAGVFSGRGDRTQVAARPFDAQAEARLADAVRSLNAENDQLRSRLAAVERNMDDITGSIARQIEAIKKTDASPAPDHSPPAAAAPGPPAMIAAPPAISAPGPGPAPAPAPAALAPAPAPAETAVVEPLPSRAALPALAAAPPSAASPAAALKYGVDVGSAVSIDVLRAHWLGIRSAHGKLFEGLTPVVMLRAVARTSRVELRLVVGPLASADAAAKLCAALVPYKLPCQPTLFSGQHIALQ